NISTVDLVWQSDGTLFDIEWGEAGFALGEGTNISDIEDTSFHLTSLNTNTVYAFYVRQVCENNQSNWTGPFSFTTTCPLGNITFTTQAQIDAFATNCPNCTEVSGNLTIQGANITDLTPL